MKKSYKIISYDLMLEPFYNDIDMRYKSYIKVKKSLLTENSDISSFANAHLYFGFHKTDNGIFYREWAPNASRIALIGEFNNWDRASNVMQKKDDGIFEIFIQGKNTIPHGSKIKIEITADNKKFDRIPLYIKRVIQDEKTKAFDGLFWFPDENFEWTDQDFKVNKKNSPFIYECHIGMSGEKEAVTTFREFTENMLPRIKKLGYNTIQLMAIMEHPYYGSFGYQVSNFYAVSSRFGTPEDLKELINTAHKNDITVLLDLVHSHAAKNTDEGIGAFDGTEYQFFHSGKKGSHSAWGTKLFNYEKPEVLHFLLSNLKFWLEEYHFDGFRFDGVTSMLYLDHGLGTSFDSYKKYFSLNTDTEAITYLQLACELCKEVKPDCILIAEDMSGMPGMCLPILYGGIGFDYRLSMGVPDFWIRNLKEKRDEQWDLGMMWHELNQRRPHEKVIGYAESHDQALVGDKTIMFWLADKEMYWHMDKVSKSPVIDRAVALHKMIRLITCTLAGEGYLNFMGNEFGHPEWIDFPRLDNNWSYKHARRLWSLADNDSLRYESLMAFDIEMVRLIKENRLNLTETKLLQHNEKAKIIIFQKGDYIFSFNFNVKYNYNASIPIESLSEYVLVLDSEWQTFGGYNDDERRKVFYDDKNFLNYTIKNRSVVVMKKR